MSLLSSVFFGALQGLTEFLPVSSSGHLLLSRSLLNPYSQPLMIDIILHIGSLAAIIIFFKGFIKKNLRQLILPVLVSSIPAAVIGLGFFTKIESLFASPRFLFASFSITILFLLIFSQIKWGRVNLKKLSLTKSFGIGLFQALALIPGISRSASTIFAGKLMGLNPNTSFSFAFVMAIPAILGSMIISLFKLDPSSFEISTNLLLVTFMSSLTFSLVALNILKKIFKRKKIESFSLYLAALAGLSLALFT